MFTDTGFWDTFRCLFPFVNLIYPSMGEKMQEGLLNTYLESGFFPEWAKSGTSWLYGRKQFGFRSGRCFYEECDQSGCGENV